MPASIFASVDFPEPFSPMIASVWFSRRVKLSGFTASTVLTTEQPRAVAEGFAQVAHFQQGFDHVIALSMFSGK